jgi:ABC-2 type transport system ATP-binding protein
VTELCKIYGRESVAVDRISFSVHSGQIVGLLGPNGAGKTTTISMILGVLEPTSGSVSIDGMPLRTRRTTALERTNFAAVYAPLPGNLTVVENLRFFGLVYNLRNLNERIEVLLKQYDLFRFRDTKTGLLSSGEQTRVTLAKAMLNQPRLLLLDEPTASLDPSTARDIRARIRDLFAMTMPASCGPRTTCMRYRRSAIACCFCLAAASCWRETLGRCPRNTANIHLRSCSSPWHGNR